MTWEDYRADMKSQEKRARNSQPIPRDQLAQVTQFAPQNRLGDGAGAGWGQKS
jgi:hypothetical protein